PGSVVCPSCPFPWLPTDTLRSGQLSRQGVVAGRPVDRCPHACHEAPEERCQSQSSLRPAAEAGGYGRAPERPPPREAKEQRRDGEMTGLQRLGQHGSGAIPAGVDELAALLLPPSESVMQDMPARIGEDEITGPQRPEREVPLGPRPQRRPRPQGGVEPTERLPGATAH